MKVLSKISISCIAASMLFATSAFAGTVVFKIHNMTKNTLTMQQVKTSNIDTLNDSDYTFWPLLNGGAHTISAQSYSSSGQVAKNDTGNQGYYDLDLHTDSKHVVNIRVNLPDTTASNDISRVTVLNGSGNMSAYIDPHSKHKNVIIDVNYSK